MLAGPVKPKITNTCAGGFNAVVMNYRTSAVIGMVGKNGLRYQEILVPL